jgi:DnaJ-class molecular chaperone
MEKERVQVTCAFCRGTGRSRGAVCPVCRGAGTVSLSTPTRRCAYCRGSGLQQRGSALTCSVCGGVGWVTVEEDAVPCPPCGGTGVEPAVLGESQLPCLICGGKGAISAEKAKKLPPAKRRPRRGRRGYGSGKVTLEY